MSGETTGLAIITGPAVTFDAETMQAWLRRRCDDGRTRAVALGIDEKFGRARPRLFGMLHRLLARLTDDPRQTAWLLHPPTEHVRFFATCSKGKADGALVVVYLDNRLRLASRHEQFADIGIHSRGIDAVIEALSNLADEANELVEMYQKKSTPDGTLTDRQVVIYGLTERQFRGLEPALGLPAYYLGRYKEWAAPRGVFLGPDFDLDAAICYARHLGLHYSETREARH